MQKLYLGIAHLITKLEFNMTDCSSHVTFLYIISTNIHYTLSVENHFPQLSTMFSVTPHCNETKNFRIWNTIWASPNYMCIWMQIFRNSRAKHYTYRSTNCKEFRHIIERSTVLSTTEYTSQNIIDGQINSFTKCKKFVL